MYPNITTTLVAINAKWNRNSIGVVFSLISETFIEVSLFYSIGTEERLKPATEHSERRHAF